MTEEEKELIEDTVNVLPPTVVVIAHNIWVNPAEPELFQASYTGPQEGSSICSSVGTDAAGEAAGDLQSVSPATASPTDTELAAPTLAGAAQEEQHCAPLPAMENQDKTERLDGAMAIFSPAPVKDVGKAELQREPNTALPLQAAGECGEEMVSLMPGEHQREAIIAVMSRAVHEEKLADILPEISVADTGTPHLVPEIDNEGSAAAFPLARDSQHQVRAMCVHWGS